MTEDQIKALKTWIQCLIIDAHSQHILDVIELNNTEDRVHEAFKVTNE